MSREWKPGDVAIVRNQWNVWNVAIYSVRHGGCVWAYGLSDAVSPATAEARPLVVIDPEDREQAIRLTDEYFAAGVQPNDPHMYAQMQAALREFATPTPPKPEEPKGWLARAEDADGVVYVRIYERGGYPWSPVMNSAVNGRRADVSKHYSWADLNIIRVLSGGQP